MGDVAIDAGAFGKRIKALYGSWRVRRRGREGLRTAWLAGRPRSEHPGPHSRRDLVAHRTTGPSCGRAPARWASPSAAPARTCGTSSPSRCTCGCLATSCQVRREREAPQQRCRSAPCAPALSDTQCPNRSTPTAGRGCWMGHTPQGGGARVVPQPQRRCGRGDAARVARSR